MQNISQTFTYQQEVGEQCKIFRLNSPVCNLYTQIFVQNLVISHLGIVIRHILLNG